MAVERIEEILKKPKYQDLLEITVLVKEIKELKESLGLEQDGEEK